MDLRLYNDFHGREFSRLCFKESRVSGIMKLQILALFVVLIAAAAAIPALDLFQNRRPAVDTPYIRTIRASNPGPKDLEGSESAYVAYQYGYGYPYYWGHYPYVIYGK